jgi:hypothetical protein
VLASAIDVVLRAVFVIPADGIHNAIVCASFHSPPALQRGACKRNRVRTRHWFEEHEVMHACLLPGMLTRWILGQEMCCAQDLRGELPLSSWLQTKEIDGPQ